jgi:hypothetical protein
MVEWRDGGYRGALWTESKVGVMTTGIASEVQREEFDSSDETRLSRKKGVTS